MDLGSIVVASTNNWIILVEEHLDLSLETELTGHKHSSSDKIPYVVESIRNSAATGVQGEKHVVIEVSVTSKDNNECSSDRNDLSD